MIDFVTHVPARIGKRDVVITVALSALGLLLMYDNVYGELAPENRTGPDQQAVIHVGNIVPYELTIPLFLLVTVPLLWRRVAPLAALAAACAGLAVNELLLGSEVLRCGVVLPTACFFAFAAGAQLQGRDALLGLALAFALAFADILVTFGPAMAFILGGFTAVFWVVGRLVQSRRRMARELQAHTAELRTARDERARMEVAADRARLSRELDELLQRRLGELARMADARPRDAEAATATLVDIEQASRSTLDEMRTAVGLLRDDAPEPATEPQPALTHIEALLVRAKGGGARLDVQGSPRVLPPAVELSAYRIVEHLLGALEDTPEVQVGVRFGDDALELSVSGPARRRARAAIERARERARLQNGSVDATVRGGHAEAVASLPVLAG